MKKPIFMGISVLVASFTSAAFGQSLRVDAPAESTSAHVTKFFIAKPAENSKNETGPLHIIYSDGTEVVRTLAQSAARNDTFPPVGFNDVNLADDGQTIGWVIDAENCCTSYPIPICVVIFRNKRVLHTLAQGQMVYTWTFRQSGKQVAILFGPTHGVGGDYRLYDTESGKLLSETFENLDTQTLDPDAPDWAKDLEYQFEHPREPK